ncbi:MAG: helix-turn-helix domain-containing protein [Acidobacteriota bacterium]
MSTDRDKTSGRHKLPRSGEGDPSDSAREKKIEYLTAQQLAEVLQISEATVHRLRRAGRIPAVLLTDRLIRFNLRHVQKALRATQAQAEQADSEDEGPNPQLSFVDIEASFSESE